MCLVVLFKNLHKILKYTIISTISNTDNVVNLIIYNNIDKLKQFADCCLMYKTLGFY